MRSPTARAQQQRVGGEAVGGGFERFGESPVGVDGQIAGQWPRSAGMIGPEDQLAGGGVCPAPLGDLCEHVADRADPAVLVGDGDDPSGLR